MFKGRTYGSSWNGRKTPDTLINNVIDAMECIKRSQNWSDSNGLPMINTASFDAVAALRPNLTGISRQILDYDKSSTKNLADEICQQFLLCCRQDEYGQECVEDLISRQNPETIVTFRDIVPKSISDVEEPEVQRIYFEPFINYGFDQATQKYKFYIRITNTDQSSFNASYVECNDSDYDPDDGAAWWATCRALRLKYRQFEAMPDSQGNNDWINNYTAAADQFSKNIEWMTKQRVSFKLPYTTARKWYVGKHFMLQLPHQTDAQNLECVIEGISRDKNNAVCNLNIILLDEATDGIIDEFNRFNVDFEIKSNKEDINVSNTDVDFTID